MAKEIRDIPEYEGLYKADDCGNIYRVCKKGLKKMTPAYDKDGYLKVHLCKQGKAKKCFVHRLVASAFIERVNPEDIVINHKNEIKDDNRVQNLEWCTVAYNTNYKNGSYRRWDGRRRAVKAINKDETMIFSCINEASKKLNLSHGDISLCLSGKRHTAGGYRWEYVA